MKIFIDAGHNYSGADTGASGYGLREEAVTFEIAEKLAARLTAFGHEAAMSRKNVTDNVGNTLYESIHGRAEMANSWGADLFICIHCNAYDGKAHGTETFVYSSQSKAAEYADRVQKRIVSNVGTTDRGVKERTDLGVLRLTVCPAIYVETAFIDNMEDNWILKTKQEEIAKSIFEGVTGQVAENKTEELTNVNDIVWEYAHRGIVLDSDGMKKEMDENPDGRLYWLARKALQYMREHNI